jgi:hypothetical protein
VRDIEPIVKFLIEKGADPKKVWEMGAIEEQEGETNCEKGRDRRASKNAEKKKCLIS